MKKRTRLRVRRTRRGVLAGLAAACAGALAPAQAAETGRHERGLAVLAQVAGGDAMRALRSIEKLAPDLARMTVDFAYGEVVSRPGLALADRELCTAAALMALGDARPQVQFHMAGFLNAGGPPEHLLELMVLSAPVLGFPAAIDAIGAVRALFAERAITARAGPILRETGSNAAAGPPMPCRWSLPRPTPIWPAGSSRFSSAR